MKAIIFYKTFYFCLLFYHFSLFCASAFPSFLLFLSRMCCLQDLSSMTWDQIQAPSSESTKSQPLDYQGLPPFHIHSGRSTRGDPTWEIHPGRSTRGDRGPRSRPSRASGLARGGARLSLLTWQRPFFTRWQQGIIFRAGTSSDSAQPTYHGGWTPLRIQGWPRDLSQASKTQSLGTFIRTFVEESGEVS